MNENLLGQADPNVPFLNAVEAWAVYDTIQIRSNASEKEGYPSYAALAAQAVWPFFDQRKLDVGIAYTNRDSNESSEFALEIYSIGCRFVAPEGLVEPESAESISNRLVHMIFCRGLLEHVGLRLKLRQDDKLIHSCYLAPDGLGPNSPSLPVLGVLAPFDYASYSNTNGEPHISGRWKFPQPLEVPRGATYSVRLEPSQYARSLIAAWPGPGAFTFDPGTGAVTVPGCSLLRMDLIGKRGVQQRNALHFG